MKRLRLIKAVKVKFKLKGKLTSVKNPTVIHETAADSFQWG